MANKDIDIKSLQKTCFIYTVNLGHVGLDTSASEDDIIEKLEGHHLTLMSFPNVKLIRAQIERNSSGVLHINGAVKFKKVIRARTLENKWKCWAEPALNEEAVMNYGKKIDTRVKELPNYGVKKAAKPKVRRPKEKAIQMLLDGMDPMEICMKEPEVYFTHHRAIVETWKMLQAAKSSRRKWDEEE